MSFEQIITIATVCISGTCTVIAALITITSISKYKTQRAYDLFTSRRLKMYDGIQKAYQELMALSSSDYIIMATAVSCDQFFADYEKRTMWKKMMLTNIARVRHIAPTGKRIRIIQNSRS